MEGLTSRPGGDVDNLPRIFIPSSWINARNRKNVFHETGVVCFLVLPFLLLFSLGFRAFLIECWEIFSADSAQQKEPKQVSKKCFYNLFLFYFTMTETFQREPHLDTTSRTNPGIVTGQFSGVTPSMFVDY